VNELIAHKFDFNLDEELLAYYITFLKTISLKLDNEMVQFFFDKDNNKFQLYERAIEYSDSKENMIQIAVRTITLNIYSGMLHFITLLNY
jgi:protein CLEC16A